MAGYVNINGAPINITDVIADGVSIERFYADNILVWQREAPGPPPLENEPPDGTDLPLIEIPINAPVAVNAVVTVPFGGSVVYRMDLPANQRFRFRVEGAASGTQVGVQGGASSHAAHGQGGLAQGEFVTGSTPVSIWICVGGQGGNPRNAGEATLPVRPIDQRRAGGSPGWNGGRTGGSRGTAANVRAGAGSGGASHIALSLQGNGLLSFYNAFRDDVLLVAGGGGAPSGSNQAGSGSGNNEVPGANGSITGQRARGGHGSGGNAQDGGQGINPTLTFPAFPGRTGIARGATINGPGFGSLAQRNIAQEGSPLYGLPLETDPRLHGGNGEFGRGGWTPTNDGPGGTNSGAGAGGGGGGWFGGGSGSHEAGGSGAGGSGRPQHPRITNHTTGLGGRNGNGQVIITRLS